MNEDSVRAWVLVGAIALMLSFSYLFMLSNEDNVSLILLFAGLFLVLDGLAGALGGALFLYLALKHGETTRVVPITSAFPIVAFAGAVIFLSEKPTLEKLLGTGLILAGLIIIQK